MVKAIWNSTVIAQSNDTIVVEGNHYFPPDSLVREYFDDSEKTTICGWKGLANYFHVTVEGKRGADTAWTYREPKVAAAEIKDYVAFWRGVQVVAE
jgi:uncharacterized protein (DUF427 family)